MKNPLPYSQYTKRSREKHAKYRGDFFRDQTAIIHSMPFRRLKHKTQVFFAPQNDHVCTRIEHVMHVATIAATICKGLSLNGWELDHEMAFAIGLGHDLGHPPFGHDGEYIINKRLGGGNAFIHEINSYRVVEYLANNGKGLNLTYGVKDGIITHNGESYEQYLKPSETINDIDNIINRKVKPSSYEGCIVRFSDKIAYLGRDIEDAIVAGFITRNDIPKEIIEKIGVTNSDIIDFFINDIIDNSKDSDTIGFSDEKFNLIKILKNFNYNKIYYHNKRLDYKPFADKIINTVFDYLIILYDKLGKDYLAYQNKVANIDKAFGRYIENMHEFYKSETNEIQIITDFISGMTDLYILESMKSIIIPKPIFSSI